MTGTGMLLVRGLPLRVLGRQMRHRRKGCGRTDKEKLRGASRRQHKQERRGVCVSVLGCVYASVHPSCSRWLLANDIFIIFDILFALVLCALLPVYNTWYSVIGIMVIYARVCCSLLILSGMLAFDLLTLIGSPLFCFGFLFSESDHRILSPQNLYKYL